jgi:hypothetical protein
MTKTIVISLFKMVIKLFTVTIHVYFMFLFKVHVNKEIFVLFHVVDENLSWYIDESIREFSPDKALLNKQDEAFKHGNLIHGL